MPDDIRRTPGEPEDAGEPAQVAEDPWAPVRRRASLEKPPSDASPPSYEEPIKRTLEYGPDEQPTIVNTPDGGGAFPGATLPSGPAHPPAPGTPPGGWGAPGGPVPPPPMAPPEPVPGLHASPGRGGFTAPTAPTGGVGPAGPAGPPGHSGHAGYPGYPGMGGHPGYGYGWPGTAMPTQNGIGTAALVLGILSVCLFFLYGIVSLVLGILAVIFGVKGRRHAERGEATNRGQAQAGLVTGIIGIVLGVLVILVVAGAKSRAGADASHLACGAAVHGQTTAPRTNTGRLPC